MSPRERGLPEGERSHRERGLPEGERSARRIQVS